MREVRHGWWIVGYVGRSAKFGGVDGVGFSRAGGGIILEYILAFKMNFKINSGYFGRREGGPPPGEGQGGRHQREDGRCYDAP